MRLHITLDDHLVAQLDERVGPRGRSKYIASSVHRALEADKRWEGVLDSIGSIPDAGHEWDEDSAAWVSAERRSDTGRVG